MQTVYYTLFPADAELLSDHISYKYQLPDDFMASKNEKKIIVQDFQFWELMSESSSGIKYYEARSGICLHGDFADLSIGIKSLSGVEQSANMNFIGLSNNDGTWITNKEYKYSRKQRYITIKFRDLLGHFIDNGYVAQTPKQDSNVDPNMDPDIDPDEYPKTDNAEPMNDPEPNKQEINRRYVFAVVMKLEY